MEQRISLITLGVADLDRSRRFYEQGLGWTKGNPQDEVAFWDYKTYVYRAQGPESEAWATPELLVDLAREYVPALDADELASCIDERRFEDAVAADYELGQQAGVDATPTVFVNGQKLESWGFEAVQAAVAAAQP